MLNIDKISTMGRKVATLATCSCIIPLALPFMLAIEIEKHTRRKPMTNLLEELGKE